jgi:hypothetical protein
MKDEQNCKAIRILKELKGKSRNVYYSNNFEKMQDNFETVQNVFSLGLDCSN